MATEIGSLLIDMRADVARLAQDMAKAQSTVESAMAKVQSSAAAAVTALSLIGVGVSVAGMANIVKGAVGAMAALDDMAAKAGTTVENFSALADVAKIGGHDIGLVETAMVRLTKALAGGDEEANGAGHALAALGLKAETLRSMDTAEALLAVAKALDQYASGSGKTALALDLLGKSGASALPYLEDLAETGKLAASVTAEQAAASERLEKDINAVKLEGEKATRAMVAGFLPTMNDIAKAMRAAAEDGGTLKALFVGFGGIATEVFNPLVAIVKQFGASLHETAAEFNEWMAKFSSGDVRQNFLRTALQERAAAQKIYAEIMALDTRRTLSGAGEGKPKLDYTAASRAHGGGGDSRLERMLKVGQQNLSASLDNEEEQRILAEKRAMADAKKEFEDLQRMLKKGEENELAAYYETAGEETIRLVVAQQELKRAGKDTFSELTRAVESWGNKAADTFADFVVDGKASFSDLVNSMLKDIARLQAKQILDPFTRGASDWLSGLFGTRSSGGSSGSDSLWMPSDVPSFAGGGDTGNGARSGGLDGQGGFLAMMHPRESVIDHALGGVGGVKVEVYDQRTAASSSPVSIEQGSSGDGMQQIRVMIRDEVGSQLAGGKQDAPLRARYGITPALTKRG